MALISSCEMPDTLVRFQQDKNFFSPDFSKNRTNGNRVVSMQTDGEKKQTRINDSRFAWGQVE